VLPLRRVLDTPRSEWEARRVGEHMLSRSEVPVLTRGEDALQAFEELAAADLHRGLVVEDGRLAGFVSISDIAGLVGDARPNRRRAG
jgi:CBS domain-containing protein